MRAGAVTLLVTVLAGALTVASACSGDDAAGPVEEAPTTTLLVAAPGDTTPGASTNESSSEPATTGVTLPAEPVATAEPTGTTAAGPTTVTVVEVPETGVPGLDSDDTFCAAWSRFGGSWQVIQVAANFAPDPAVVPAMEVVASPVIDDAYDAMFAAWPAELAEERDLVADGFFGPLDRRAEAALDALEAAGATADQLTALRSAWVAALAARQPDDPVLFPELDDELAALVDEAAADFASQRVGFVEDPSMRIAVETPRTDAYLATACPDQGALTGGEVDGG